MFPMEVHYEVWGVNVIPRLPGIMFNSQYFTVPHIVHWTPVDSGECSADVWWTMTGQASPVIVH